MEFYRKLELTQENAVGEFYRRRQKSYDVPALPCL